MLSPKAKRNISRIIPFGMIWLISGLVFFVVEKAATVGVGYASTAIQIDFKIFVFGMLAITVFGLLIGTVEVLYLDKVFAQKSFTKKIVYKLIIYFLLIFTITLIFFPIAASLELKTSIFDKAVWNKLFAYLSSMTHLSTDLQLVVALGVSLFYSEISQNMGHRVLLNFFSGKYHTPTEEKRIFMFLDMKSSTSIAEKLGHMTYFELLNQYYVDLSDAIIEHAGEVYQYVGDEIVISWQYQVGLKNNNCINCFFAMKKRLQKQTARYEKSFGVSPTFKAGLHYGKVTTGEIGALKKEIIYTGDVLNATSRIQSLCNQYNTDLLISGELIESLHPISGFQIKPLGKTELRGKLETMELYTVEL